MDLTIRYLLSIPFARRAINEKKAAVVTPCSTTKRVNPGTFSCTATASITTDKTPFERETQKHNLLRAIQDTQRGLVATSDQRSSIEEALVCVEGYEAGSPIDLVKLDGTWRLQYTSAPDVLVLLVSAARLPFFQVGQIYQKFECRDNSDCGIVRNVVRWSIPSLLEEQEGATLLVSAKFSVVSKRNINLQFEEVAIQNINISEELQAVIAPAILPRTFLSLQILQFIRGFRAQFPLRSSERKLVGGLYYLTYLDGNMLLGRAVGGGGVFVFTKAQPLT
ncbi:probable plastid-lipid-associated protein 10, chloroplastic isoform X3 [Macadamia integrifolia]|uniref:probable plastid-lipid-associated protein 10, chloroplastic isoform X3 n=1 Tax=Macadamia integrifolia TaxID=60698 RepID=UPI001C4FA9C0|nr:probable plastid-lipid-associated protein 10, chloroplastic isoform X3 [Macadamia integrifolia]